MSKSAGVGSVMSGREGDAPSRVAEKQAHSSPSSNRPEESWAGPAHAHPSRMAHALTADASAWRPPCTSNAPSPARAPADRQTSAPRSQLIERRPRPDRMMRRPLSRRVQPKSFPAATPRTRSYAASVPSCAGYLPRCSSPTLGQIPRLLKKMRRSGLSPSRHMTLEHDVRDPHERVDHDYEWTDPCSIGVAQA